VAGEKGTVSKVILRHANPSSTQGYTSGRSATKRQLDESNSPITGTVAVNTSWGKYDFVHFLGDDQEYELAQIG
jgi:hypothetical protein